MPGLDFIKRYQEGGLATEPPSEEKTETRPVAVGKAPVSKGPYALPTATGNVGVDEGLLARMQQLIDERESRKGGLREAMLDAQAWWSGGEAGPYRALEARRAQKEADEATTFGMRRDLAQYRNQQAQQEAFNRRREQMLGSPAASAGGIGEATIPEQIRTALIGARNEDEWNKIYNTWAQKQAEIYANPAMDEPKIPVVDMASGKPVLRTISTREYRENPGRYRDTPQTQAAVQSVMSPTAAPSGATIPTSAIRQVESGNNAAAVSPKGAEGTMQVMPATQKAPGFGVSPAANKTPQELERVGGDYFQAMKNKYKDDVIAAIAYNMGPGATDKWIANGKKFNELPAETQQYVNRLTSQPQAPAADIPKMRAETAVARPSVSEMQQQQKEAETYRNKLAEGAAANAIAAEKEFRKTTESKSVAERKTSAERVISLVQQYPQAVGILAKEGVANALFTIARDGINTPSGRIGIKDIEDALLLTMPGTSQQIINARKEIAQNLARAALETSKLVEGQGAVSDYERTLFERVSGSLADTPQLLIKRQQMLVARAELDQKLGTLYRQSRTPGKPGDYETFTARQDVVDLIDKYENQLRDILGSEVNVGKPGSTSGKTPGGISFKVITPAKTQ